MVARRPAAGFTLVELLVAAAVTLVSLGLGFALLGPSAAAFHSLPEAIDAQQRLRVAVQTLAQGISEAGAGPVLAWGARGTPAWPAILPCRAVSDPLGLLPGGCASEDALTVTAMEATAPQAAVAADLADAAAPIRLAPLSACTLAAAPCRLHAGAHVLVADGTGAWDVVPVSAVPLDGSFVEHAGAPVSRLYRAGALLGEVERTAYSLRPDPATHVPQLRRETSRSSDLPVLDHVTALRFEYFGAAAVPLVLDDADVDRRRTTYGPLPPPAGLDDGLDTWVAGENCVFARESGAPVARLAVLPVEHQGLTRLPASLFADGPWCPDASSQNRYDADLLRIRLVRVVVRIEAQSASVRGTDALLFSRPGSGREALRLVPDVEGHVDAAVRNAAR